MAEYQYDIPLPKRQRELLLKLAEKSRQRDILSIGYTIHKHKKPPYGLVFTVGDEEFKVESFEDPIPGFEVLGLIKQIDEHTIFLTPKLFKWAGYESKNPLMKWVERNPNIARDVLLGISILLSLILLLLRLFQN